MLTIATPPTINVILLELAAMIQAAYPRNLTYCFLRLANLDNRVLERLGRYEAALWRQMMQTLFALQTVRHR